MFLDHQGNDCHEQLLAYEFDNPMSPNHNVTIRPTDKELDLIARDIKKFFDDKIQWCDIPIITKLASHYLDDFSHITTESKQDSATHILFYVIENTATSNLPETFFSPLFKNMAPHFVNIIIPESLNEYITPVKINGKPTDKLIEEYANDIIETFEDGFQWKDLATITKLGVMFTYQFKDLQLEEKKVNAKKFINYVIDSTEAKNLPEYYVDSIFKIVSGATVEIIIDQLLIK